MKQSDFALPYFMVFTCDGRRVWTLLRENKLKAPPSPFVAMTPGSGQDGSHSENGVAMKRLSLSDALVAVDGDGRGCHLSVGAGEDNVHIGVEGDGTIAWIEPPAEDSP